MLLPPDVRSWASQRLSNQRRTWIDGGGAWPLIRGLEPPKETDIRGGLDAVTKWTSAWQAARLPPGVRLERTTFLMRGIGSQTMPVRIEFDSPRAVADFAGAVDAWDGVQRRKAALMARWPQLTPASGLGRLYDWLSKADDPDVERLIAVTTWIIANPRSGLYLRQLPVTGVDTKWIEGGQRRAIAVLVGLLRGDASVGDEADKDFLRLCGLRAPANRVRIMVLDPELRRIVGNVRDLSAPVTELSVIPWAPRKTLFLENAISALSLPDLEATVAVVGLGGAVSVSSEISWIHHTATFYWGDIDTDGLKILTLARAAFPGIRSVLMDTDTLHRYQSRWVPEAEANHQADRALLSPEELALYEALLTNEWKGWREKRGVRLEQERLDWSHVESELRELIGQDTSSRPSMHSTLSVDTVECRG